MDETIKSQKKLTLTGIFSLLVLFCLMASCANQDQTSSNTYKKDLDFLQKHIRVIELSDSLHHSKLIVVPAWQGRVMTSTANGDEGDSYGWINYKLLESDKKDAHFNAFGGEERLWLGPEGGPFSLYFAPGSTQQFQNWTVAPALDTDSFEVVGKTASSVKLKSRFNLKNYFGTEFNIEIKRSVKLVPGTKAEATLGIALPSGLKYVAYESSNSLINNGQNSWTKDSGLLSIWMLSQFTSSPGVTVFIPYKEGPDSLLGPVVSTDYFGKIPPERIRIEPGTIFFKSDGKYRSKIGISPKRANPFLGSYDTVHHTLTILWIKQSENSGVYVNSKWGKQPDPFNGDAVNSYNDGPTETGAQLGPFYEMESSSPAAALNPGDSIVHSQRIFHFEGIEEDLTQITEKVFGLSISKIKKVF